jgi:NADH:ubiquinone oxidoreductase subunit 6 (subunit J)
MTHVYAVVLILAVMVLFLFLIGLLQLREFRRLALRITYLEGTLDMILEYVSSVAKKP